MSNRSPYSDRNQSAIIKTPLVFFKGCQYALLMIS